jgi:hypothetical protein
MMLNFLLETMPHRRRVLRTAHLVPSFDTEDMLTGLVERVKLSQDVMDIMEGERADIGGTRVDSIPFHKVISSISISRL